MRILLLTVLAAIVACNPRTSSVSSDGAPSTQTRTTAMTAAAQADEVTIPVDGMSCAACAARLKRGLAKVEGVVDVEVSFEKANARIHYMPSKTSPEQLSAAIRALDFTPGTASLSTVR